ncbi:MAG: hypothetical protein ABI601_00510 [bacterium]
MDRERDKQLDTRAHDLDDTEEISTTDGTPRGDAPNPPRTTAGGITAPKFGSAGSGGAELEPGPERD